MIQSPISVFTAEVYHHCTTAVPPPYHVAIHPSPAPAPAPTLILTVLSPCCSLSAWDHEERPLASPNPFLPPQVAFPPHYEANFTSPLTQVKAHTHAKPVPVSYQTGRHMVNDGFDFSKGPVLLGDSNPRRQTMKIGIPESVGFRKVRFERVLLVNRSATMHMSYRMPDRDGCAADFGAVVGGPVCCEQTGTIASQYHICSAETPHCSGFVQGVQLGECLRPAPPPPPMKPVWERLTDRVRQKADAIGAYMGDVLF